MHSVQDEIVRLVYRVQVQTSQEPYRNPYRNVQMRTADMLPELAEEEGIEMARRHAEFQPTLVKHKVGRNDPCPCGSGKKYKKCCLLKEEQQ